MNIQRFVLPVTVAAALHAVLLYALPNPQHPLVTTKKAPLGEAPKQIPIDLVPLPPPAEEVFHEVVPLQKGSPRPTNDEMFQAMRETPFVVPPISEVSRRVTDINTIERIGVPEGTLTDVSMGDINQRFTDCVLLDQQPRAKMQLPPDYPATMKQDNRSGTVLVEFDVDVKGRVVGARVRQSTDRGFEEPTIRAVLKWRFEPGLSKGQPVPFRMVIPVNFTLGAD